MFTSRGKYLVSLAIQGQAVIDGLLVDNLEPVPITQIEHNNNTTNEDNIIIEASTSTIISDPHRNSVTDSSSKSVPSISIEQHNDEVDEITGYSDDSLYDPDYNESDSPSEIITDEENNLLDVQNDTSTEKEGDHPVTRPTKKKRLRKDSERAARDKGTHLLRSPCACKSRCITKIREEKRKSIWNEFYKMTYSKRRAWVHGRVIQKNKKRQITISAVSKRGRSLTYSLPDENGYIQVVCKKFFLRTLGYNEKNDKFITTMLRNSTAEGITPKLDRRGSVEPANKCDREILRQHISSFHPCVSHYRREHAPRRLYLPSDITIRSMLADYLNKYPNKKVSYYTYRRVVSEMNISFTKLGHEECDNCMLHVQHLKSHNETTAMIVQDDDDPDQVEHRNDPVNSIATDPTSIASREDESFSVLDSSSKKYQATCTNCKNWLKHSEKARVARAEYRKDVAQTTSDVVRSVDLQKVIMLPRMPGSKKACFTKRIVAFHLTFATMADPKRKSGKKNLSIVWHEAVAGRKAEEIASAYCKALLEERDSRNVIYWTDNCAAQNKNWCLFTTLVTMINSDLIVATEITLKYFETGHTFMSADSVHHGVELSMKNMSKGNVYDFNDFVRVVENSNGKKMKVICLKNEDVLHWVAGDSKAKSKTSDRPLLCNISVVQFRRGSRSLFYKDNINDDEFKEFNFLKLNFKLEIPQQLRDNPRGIPSEKKQTIISILCPKMPANRQKFWLDLLENDVEDLINDFD